MGSTGTTTMQERARNTGLMWVGILMDQALVSGTNFATLVIVGRSLGRKELGVYVLLYSVVIILLEVQNSFIASPYTLEVAQGDRATRTRLNGDALLLSSALALSASLVILVSSSIASHIVGNATSLAGRMAILSLSLPPLILKEQARRTCIAQFRTGSLLLLDIIVSMVQLIGVSSLQIWFGGSIRGVYSWIGTASGLATLIWAVRWRRELRFDFTCAAETLRRTLSFGALVLTGNLAVVLSQQAYPWYLTWLRGPEATGTFAAFVGVLGLINPLMTAIGNQLGPLTARAAMRGSEALSHFIGRACVFVTVVVALICALLILFRMQVIQLLYGPSFSISLNVFAILAFSAIVFHMSSPLGFGLWAVGRPDINLKINLIALGCSASFGFWLADTLGLLGAACGLLMGNAAVSLTRFIAARMLIRSNSRIGPCPESIGCQID